MRLIPLLLLAAVVISAVAIFGFNVGGLRTKIFSGGKAALEASQGYSVAKTPAEAVERFRKAIVDRKYAVAAKYVNGNYGKYLVLANDAGVELAEYVDNIRNFAKNHKPPLSTTNTTFLLQLLDPFPTNFVAQGNSYVYESVPPPDSTIEKELPRLDGVMFSNCLHPTGKSAGFTVEVLPEGKGDAKEFKLSINISDPRAQGIVYFNDNHKQYVKRLQKFMNEANNQRWERPAEFEKELIKAFVEVKIGL